MASLWWSSMGILQKMWTVQNSTHEWSPKCVYFTNSLGPSDAIWRQRSGSTLAQVMACCLKAPSHTWINVDLSSVRSKDIHIEEISWEMSQPSSHYLNQYQLIIKEVLWHSPESNSTATAQGTVLYNEFKNVKFATTSLRGQWVNPVSFGLAWTSI